MEKGFIILLNGKKVFETNSSSLGCALRDANKLGSLEAERGHLEFIPADTYMEEGKDAVPEHRLYTKLTEMRQDRRAQADNELSTLAAIEEDVLCQRYDRSRQKFVVIGMVYNGNEVFNGTKIECINHLRSEEGLSALDAKHRVDGMELAYQTEPITLAFARETAY